MRDMFIQYLIDFSSTYFDDDLSWVNWNNTSNLELITLHEKLVQQQVVFSVYDTEDDDAE